MALLICSRHYSREDEPLALIVWPAICDALAHLLEHGDVAECLLGANTRILALSSVLRSLGSGEDEGSTCDEYGALLKRRLSSTARRMLWEVCLRRFMNLSGLLTVEQTDGEQKGNVEEDRKRKHELVICRLDGFSRLLYIREV